MMHQSLNVQGILSGCPRGEGQGMGKEERKIFLQFVFLDWLFSLIIFCYP